MKRTGWRRSFIAGLMLSVFLSYGIVLISQERAGNDDFLFGALFRAIGLVDRVAADLQKINRDIQENDRIIKKAEDIIALARQADNKEAESAARDALLNAQASKKKNEAARARLELARTRAAAAYAAIKNRFSASQGGGRDSQIRGFVSNYTGRVQVSKKNGDYFELENENPGLLEPGDSIMTYGSSGAEIQTLDGRGTVQLGEYSEFKLQEDTAEKQVVELVRGKIYSAVDKADDLIKILRDQSERYAEELGKSVADAEKWFRRKFVKKFEMRTSCGGGAVRGTKFSVELKNGEEAEFAVHEGAVEVSDLRGEKTVLVEAGFKVVATKNGISEPAKIGEIVKWWEK